MKRPGISGHAGESASGLARADQEVGMVFDVCKGEAANSE